MPDIRTPSADADPGDGERTPVRYLPSAQVLAELASLGPDLRRLGDDLRDRLTGSSEDRNDAAARSV